MSIWRLALNEFKYRLSVIYTNKIYYLAAGLILMAIAASGDLQYIFKTLEIDYIVPCLLVSLSLLCPIFYCGSLIHQTIYEFAEKRLRIQSSKPMDIKQIGKARFIGSLLYWLMFALIFYCISKLAIMSIQWTDSMQNQVKYEWIGYNEVDLKRVMNWMMITMYLTFAFRTFFESSIRIVGITFLGFLVSWYMIISELVPFDYSNEIQYLIDGTVHSGIAMMLSLIFASLTYYSFTRRRSFLA